jgi:tetratricopeptide (TPR) repeat protein
LHLAKFLNHAVNKIAMTKKIPITVCLIFAATLAFAQITFPPGGTNRKASVSQRIGITDVRIDYDRPIVNGREGKIWGGLVHYGFADLHYGTSKAAPWRAGANENTTFTFSTDVLIEGKPLKAGKYGFFIAMGPEKATLVFSNVSTAWGSFYYDSKDDALRVEVPVAKLTESVERLIYVFSDETDDAAIVSLRWEKVKIPFKVSVDLEKEQLAAFRREFNSGIFYRYWQNMQMAANYCLVHNINIDEAIGWADRSINTYFGEKNFSTLSTYAGLLEKKGMKNKADSVMKTAYSLATTLQLYSYGRGLENQKRNEEAITVYKMSYDRNPDDLYSCMAITRGYSLQGNNKEALKYANKTLTYAKDSYFKKYADEVIVNLKEGKPLY